MEFRIEATCQLELEFAGEGKPPRLKATSYSMEVSKELDRKMYFNENMSLNKDGVKTAMNVFVQGLLSNLHYAHNENIWDSAEHLRKIISELERGFVQVTKSEVSTFTPLKDENNKSNP